MDYLSEKEAAARVNVGVRSLQEGCKGGRIPGVYKQLSEWWIPMNAQKPQDTAKSCEHAPTALYPGLFLMESIRLDGRSAETIAAELPNDAYRRQFWAELAYL